MPASNSRAVKSCHSIVSAAGATQPTVMTPTPMAVFASIAAMVNMTHAYI